MYPLIFFFLFKNQFYLSSETVIRWCYVCLALYEVNTRLQNKHTRFHEYHRVFTWDLFLTIFLYVSSNCTIVPVQVRNAWCAENFVYKKERDAEVAIKGQHDGFIPLPKGVLPLAKSARLVKRIM